MKTAAELNEIQLWFIYVLTLDKEIQLLFSSNSYPGISKMTETVTSTRTIICTGFVAFIVLVYLVINPFQQSFLNILSLESGSLYHKKVDENAHFTFDDKDNSGFVGFTVGDKFRNYDMWGVSTTSVPPTEVVIEHLRSKSCALVIVADSETVEEDWKLLATKEENLVYLSSNMQRDFRLNTVQEVSCKLRSS